MSRYIDADALKRYIPTRMDMQDLYLPVHFKTLIDEQPTVDAISMREWNLLRNSIKELQENNTEKKDVQFVTKFLLRLMDISERREFNNEM